MLLTFIIFIIQSQVGAIPVFSRLCFRVIKFRTWKNWRDKMIEQSFHARIITTFL